MRKSFFLFFQCLLFSQNWTPFHSYELNKFNNFEIEYQIADDRAREVINFNPDRNYLTHEVIGYLPYWEYDQYPNLNYDLLTQINFFSAELDQYGDIVNDHNWENLYLVEFAQARGVKVKLCATLFGQESLGILLNNYFYRQNAINNLLNLVMSVGADGVDIDFELLPTNQRDNLVLFMEELSFIFHLNMDDPIITMATPAIDWSNAWDYNALAEITDGLFIMGYNYFYSGSSTAGPVSPLGGYYYDIEYSVNDYIAKTNGQLEKLILGLPYYGYDWPVSSSIINSATIGYGSTRTYSEASLMSNEYGYNWDMPSNSFWIQYLSNSWQQCWYDDSLSLSLKYQFAIEKNIQGVGIWALGYDQGSDKLWGAINDQFNPILVGDLNLDREINIQDVIIIINEIMNLAPYNPSADFNSDYMINILDILGIINMILND
ncbi:MAG: hypothetical protein CMG13_01780 [Candidatus Marinimicrobia bacterium]|nr:hypothetical protein [Candidatus Neomarinimicrobiota bacterium]|tara:strand:+ start:3570 stop:4871 length:1302 start_codon:yes stop_codon:yes gene_type:complete